MEDLFKKPVLLPRPKKTFHQKSTPLLGLRKLWPLINKSVEDIDKFEEKEMMKKRPFTKSTWFERLIYHILESVKKKGGRY